VFRGSGAPVRGEGHIRPYRRHPRGLRPRHRDPRGAIRRRHVVPAGSHFDAHLDTGDTYFNAPITHGTIFRRAFEEGLLIEDHSIHVGIWGPTYDQFDLDDDARMGLKIIRAGDLDLIGIGAAIDVAVRLPTR